MLTKVERHRKWSDEEFESRFRTRKFPAGNFSHEAHLRLAWIHLKQYGREQAAENCAVQIKAFAEGLGIYDKFNHTVTVAFVYLVDRFLQEAPELSFYDFLERFPILSTGYKELLSEHYSVNIFRDDRARKGWLEPDLKGF